MLESLGMAVLVLMKILPGVWSIEMLDQELITAINAVRKAALFCHKIRNENRIRPLVKFDGSPVTNADFGSQAIIVNSLRQAFAIDPIMAEETASMTDFQSSHDFTAELLQDLAQAHTPFSSIDALVQTINRDLVDIQSSVQVNPSWRNRYWVIDPIDGTKGYLKGGQYAVALALIEKGDVKVSVVACPEFRLPVREETGWILYAQLGKGAFAVPLNADSEPVKIHVGANGPDSSLILCESLNHSPHGTSGQVANRLAILDQNIIKMDSQAKYATVACGAAHIYLRLPTSSSYREAVWDHAPGFLVITEAGGKVTDIDGQPMIWTDSRDWEGNHRFAHGRGVIVTNGHIHLDVLNAIQKVLGKAKGESAP